MIEDFRIHLEHPNLHYLGDSVVAKPWLWTCKFRLDGKEYCAALLQDSEYRSPRRAAMQFEQALKRLTHASRPSH